MQGSVHGFPASRAPALVHRHLWPCTVPDRGHGHWAAMLESYHIPLRQGYDAQGLPAEHDLNGSYYGQLC